MTVRLEDSLERSARGSRGASAVVDGERTLSYGELSDRASVWADRLSGVGCRPGGRVVLAAPKSADAIIAMHAVLACDASYVPLDLDSPAARLRKVIDSSRPSAIVAAGALKPAAAAAIARASDEHGAPVAWIDGSRDAPGDLAGAVAATEATPPAGRAPERSRRTNEIAHILFTSGSTGVPKGVMVRHASVAAFTDWANRYFDARPGDRNSGHSPLFFDLSTWDVFGTLASGGELHLVPPSLNLIAARIAEFIRERRLTRWFSVPSILAYMAKFDVVKESDFPDLRELVWCGEVFPTPALRYWMTRLPHVRFTNLYGPTEATIASSYYTLERVPETDLEETPIGVACDGEALHVVDASLRPLPPGELGELCISGAGLAPGYWGDPQRSAEAFVRGPDGTRLYRTGDLALRDEHGLVRFRGRADRQIKSRGYRIELGEIEAALGALDELAESAVVAVETGGFEGCRICCAAVPADGTFPTPAGLSRSLRGLIPAYMVPAEWMFLERLPRTGNNKIDRKAVRERFSADFAGEGGDQTAR